MPDEQPERRYKILPVTSGGFVLYDPEAQNGKGGLRRSKNVSELLRIARMLLEMEDDEADRQTT